MHVGFSGYLKHVGSFTSFRYLQFSPNVFLVESSMHELKSPSKIKLSYLDATESTILERESRCDSILPCTLIPRAI